MRINELFLKLHTILTTENVVTMNKKHLKEACLRKPWRYIVSGHGYEIDGKNTEYSDLVTLADSVHSEIQRKSEDH